MQTIPKGMMSVFSTDWAPKNARWWSNTNQLANGLSFVLSRSSPLIIDFDIFHHDVCKAPALAACLESVVDLRYPNGGICSFLDL